MTDNPAVTDAVNNLRYVIGNAEAHNISQHTATNIHIVLAELSRRPPTMAASSDELKAAAAVELLQEVLKYSQYPPVSLEEEDVAALSLLLTELARLQAEVAELKAAGKPFATWGTPRLTEDGVDQLEGTPDCHGWQIIWADEGDGDRVELTTGQFRRIRAAITAAKGGRG